MIQQLFLPFTKQGRATEEVAVKIKADHGFGPYESVNPADLAQRMGVIVVADSWFGSLPPEIVELALGRFSSAWSAGSISCEGRLWVLVNPAHLQVRRALSLAEELVHESLGHPKSKLVEIEGLTFRTCDHSLEDEAYSVAAALVVPYRPLFNHVNGGQPLEDLVTAVPVSQQALEFRVKRTGLWRTYQARRRVLYSS